ncbi:hypothetical protein JKP88DRAFT_283934 [Tribonema minus]|uniref:2-dehydro-3-deoxy-6-phosphogalactonate aldolase n=1 Tax=Tribonema minus TaxID=303371 RepID=A0A835YGH8_9STRA|nr:hypothetical protein JKP88DRAFT_283934 [Tribonema minus]
MVDSLLAAGLNVAAIAHALAAAGFNAVSVTADTPLFARSIATLASTFGQQQLLTVGASSVSSPDAVRAAAAAGARFVSSTEARAEVVAAAAALGITSLPGVRGAADAASALDMGATALKLFPAASVGAGALRGIRGLGGVMEHVPVIAAGGLEPESLQSLIDAGASGFAIGSTLYRGGDSPRDVARRAALFAAAAAASAPLPLLPL